MSFFDPNASHGFETRFGEIILGLFTINSGWTALHAVPDDVFKSQLRGLLELQGSPFGWGAVLCFLGIGSAVFALSRFSPIRLFIHGGLFLTWTAIIILFLGYRQPGPPLFNGMIFSLASIAVCCTILFHEKHAHNHC